MYLIIVASCCDLVESFFCYNWIFLCSFLLESVDLFRGVSHVPFCIQALLHASVECSRKLVVEWVAATDLEDATAAKVS